MSVCKSFCVVSCGFEFKSIKTDKCSSTLCLDIATYMSAMSEGIEYYGANGITAFDRNSAFAKLTPDQREFAYNEGKKYAKTTFAILENAAKKSETAYNRKMGRVFFETGVKARSELEKQSVNLARVVSIATGIDIRFFDSTKDTRKSNFNGRYDGAPVQSGLI